MQTLPLSANLGAVAERVDPILPETSLETAARILRESGLPALPVARDGQIEGVFDELAVVRSLGMGFDLQAPVSSLPLSQVPSLWASASGAAALRTFDETGAPLVLVVDRDLRLVGVVTPARLIPAPDLEARPRLVGGMATPFGVYLTTGAQGGGVPMWSLVVTGAALFTVLLVAQLAADWVGGQLAGYRVPGPWIDSVVGLLSTGLFLAAIRFSPIAGYHAAEHMVVHAIERGERLQPDIIARMPRVHPRCGTNLAVGAALFLGFANWQAIPDPDLRLLIALVITVTLWRRIGGWVQYFATTRRPNRKQIDSGIRAGEEVLKRYRLAPVAVISPWTRLVNSGIFHIMAGSILMSLIVEGVTRLFNLPPIIKLV